MDGVALPLPVPTRFFELFFFDRFLRNLFHSMMWYALPPKNPLLGAVANSFLPCSYSFYTRFLASLPGVLPSLYLQRPETCNGAILETPVRRLFFFSPNYNFPGSWAWVFPPPPTGTPFSCWGIVEPCRHHHRASGWTAIFEFSPPPLIVFSLSARSTAFFHNTYGFYPTHLFFTTPNCWRCAIDVVFYRDEQDDYPPFPTPRCLLC